MRRLRARLARREVLALISVLVVLAIALPLAGPALQRALLSTPVVPPPEPYLNATVSLGAEEGFHLASPFYAVVFTAVNSPTSTLAAMGSFLNSTPMTWFRFGGGGEGYDPTTATDWVAPAGGGLYHATHVQLWNFTWFEAWCASRPIPCHWLGYLPTELNDTQAALHTAEWYHSVLGFTPDLWQFGNEPEAWSHYGENYSGWSTVDAHAATPLDYAVAVRNEIAAVSAAFPADRYVGIEASCPTCDPAFVNLTAALNGPRLSAMAYHLYPWASGSSSSSAQFYGALYGGQSLPRATAGFAGLYRTACASCPGLPLQVGEYQAGPAGSRSPLASEYPGAVFLGASVIQALESNVSSFTVFDSNALFEPSTGAPTPEGLLYQRFLDNLTMGADFAAPVTTPGVGGVFSLVVENGTRDSLFIVNTNATLGLNLTIPSGLLGAGPQGRAWYWEPGGLAPTYQPTAPLSGTFRLPAQGILLLDNF